METELRTINIRLKRIDEDAIAEGVSAFTLKEELLSLETRKATLEKELVGLREEPVRLHPNMAEVYRRSPISWLSSLKARMIRRRPLKPSEPSLTGSFSRLSTAS